MPEQKTQQEFEFELLLKNINEDLTDSQRDLLHTFHICFNSYEFAWESHQMQQNVKNAGIVQPKINDIIKTQDQINNTLSTLFLQAPESAKAKGLWDGGKEKARRIGREQTLFSLKQSITARFITLKKHHIEIDNYLQQSTNSSPVKSQTESQRENQAETPVQAQPVISNQVITQAKQASETQPENKEKHGTEAKQPQAANTENKLTPPLASNHSSVCNSFKTESSITSFDDDHCENFLHNSLFDE